MITSAIPTGVKHSEVARLHLILKLTYGLVPIVAGLDKFTNILTDWSKYLNTDLLQVLPLNAPTFMVIVGIIEIAAGILVLWKTELGAYVVAAWLVCIALTLIMSFNYLDVAVRDIVMAIGAYALARLTRVNSGTA
jgi:uncharacterized membrane protein YphA (DoxX/SURF4 family)